MKQAILITAYKNFSQLGFMISCFDYQLFNVYVHIDKKSKISKEALKSLKKIHSVKYVSRKYWVNWGGINHLNAILHLSSQALKDEENVYFHLITGEDFPIKTNTYFETKFKKKG